MGFVFTFMTWGHIQPWYQVGLLLLWPVAVAAGGCIRAGKPTLGDNRIGPVL